MAKHIVDFCNAVRLAVAGALALVLMAVAIVGTPSPAYAATNHTQAEAIAWTNDKYYSNWAVDYDGYAGVQCVDLILAYYDYLVGWHTSGNAINYTSNQLPAGWSRVYSNPQAGDVVVWNRGAQIGHGSVAYADPNYGHIGICTAVRNGYIVCIETNANGVQKASPYNRSIGGVACYIRPDFKTSDTTKPTVSNVRVSNIDSTGYTVTANVSDNVGVTQVKFPSWNNDQYRGEDAVWLVGTVNNGVATCRVLYSKLKGGAVDGRYMTHVYADDAAGNSGSGRMPNLVVRDTAGPYVHDRVSKNFSATGFRFEFKVSDKYSQVKSVAVYSKAARSNGVAVHAPSADSAGMYACDIRASSGPCEIQVAMSDSRGNSSTEKFTVTVPAAQTAITSVTIADQLYKGAANLPAPVPTVKAGNKTLTANTDFTYSIAYNKGHDNNKYVGTAKVTVTGKGSYTGTLTKTFKIKTVADSMTVGAALTEKTVTTIDKVKTGENKVPQANSKTMETIAKPRAEQMTVNWKAVAGATNYLVGYKRSTDRQWSYVVSGGKTSYTFNGMVEGNLMEFRVAVYDGTKFARSEWTQINCRFYREMVSLKATTGVARISLAWGKVSGATGYQVLLGRESDLSDAKVITIKGGSKKSVKLTESYGLGAYDGNDFYYLKMRAIKTAKNINGKTNTYIGIHSLRRTCIIDEPAWLSSGSFR